MSNKYGRCYIEGETPTQPNIELNHSKYDDKAFGIDGMSRRELARYEHIIIGKPQPFAPPTSRVGEIVLSCIQEEARRGSQRAIEWLVYYDAKFGEKAEVA